MKRASIATFFALLLLVPALTFGQAVTVKQAGTPSEARASFDLLKSLAGRWKGRSSVTFPAPDSFPVQVLLRITSGGDALMHEMTPEGRADDPSHGDDDPVTMFYLDGDRLLLTHYCDAGKNRPRMAAKRSADGKTVEFDFLDLSGETRRGHMHHAVFTWVDADNHIEDWTYVFPNGKQGTAHIVLARSK